jgi:CNT family concentrative nucleoside transporter
MSRSELFALMTTGMATIAGTVMVLSGILREALPGAPGRSHRPLISAPAAIVVASC